MSALKNSVVGAALLLPGVAFGKGTGAGVTTGGKTQLGVNLLSLDVAPGYNTTVCATQASVSGKNGSNFTPNELSIAVDPFSGSYSELQFTVSDVQAMGEDYVLYLVYSPKVSPSPQIPTPSSLKKLDLDLSGLEILAMYSVPAQKLLNQNSTRLGAANPAVHSKLVFSVNLDTSTLPNFMNNNTNVYLQAALLKKVDHDKQRFDGMILSETNKLNFVKNTCPSTAKASASMDGSGVLKVTNSSGATTKTTDTKITTTSATTKTK